MFPSLQHAEKSILCLTFSGVERANVLKELSQGAWCLTEVPYTCVPHLGTLLGSLGFPHQGLPYSPTLYPLTQSVDSSGIAVLLGLSPHPSLRRELPWKAVVDGTLGTLAWSSGSAEGSLGILSSFSVTRGRKIWRPRKKCVISVLLNHDIQSGSQAGTVQDSGPCRYWSSLLG